MSVVKAWPRFTEDRVAAASGCVSAGLKLIRGRRTCGPGVDQAHQ